MKCGKKPGIAIMRFCYLGVFFYLIPVIFATNRKKEKEQLRYSKSYIENELEDLYNLLYKNFIPLIRPVENAGIGNGTTIFYPNVLNRPDFNNCNPNSTLIASGSPLEINQSPLSNTSYSVSPLNTDQSPDTYNPPVLDQPFDTPNQSSVTTYSDIPFTINQSPPDTSRLDFHPNIGQPSDTSYLDTPSTSSNPDSPLDQSPVYFDNLDMNQYIDTYTNTTSMSFSEIESFYETIDLDDNHLMIDDL